MTTNPKHVAVLVALALIPSCGGSSQNRRSAAATSAPITAHLRNGRVMPSELEVPSGGQILFVNNDGRAHQIYSGDCSELSSKLLEPGHSAAAVVGVGPKMCNFRDLLAPTAFEYWGTVSVAAPAPGSEVSFNPGAQGR